MAPKTWPHQQKKIKRYKKNSNGVDSFNENEVSVCKWCIESKQHRASFSKVRATQAKELLGLVCSHISRKIQTTTHSGCHYYLTFIDNYLRYTFVYLIKYKNKVFNKFIQLKEFFERQRNH